MSLNELFQDTHKPWLNAYFNTVHIDGALNIPGIVGVPGQYLQIINGKAAWGPVPSGIYGGTFAAVVQAPSGSFTGGLEVTFGYELIPYNANLYDFERGTQSITVLQTGLYYIYYKGSYTNGTAGIVGNVWRNFNTSPQVLLEFITSSPNSTQPNMIANSIVCSGVASLTAGDTISVVLTASGIEGMAIETNVIGFVFLE